MPGWPLPTFWTASMARTRTVSTAFWSTSFQSSSAGLLTGILSGHSTCGLSNGANVTGVGAQARPSLLTRRDTIEPSKHPLMVTRPT